MLFRAKLTHVSPVWYQIKRKDGVSGLKGRMQAGAGHATPGTLMRTTRARTHGAQAWLLEGGHEYNETWVNEVRQPGGKEGAAVTRVVPRVIVELDSAEVRAPWPRLLCTPTGWGASRHPAPRKHDCCVAGTLRARSTTLSLCAPPGRRPP